MLVMWFHDTKLSDKGADEIFVKRRSGPRSTGSATRRQEFQTERQCTGTICQPLKRGPGLCWLRWAGHAP